MKRVVLFRAADDDICTGPTSFARNIESARAYLDNRAFGGRRLFRSVVEYDDAQVLDVRSDRDDEQLDALVQASGLPHPGAMTADMFVVQDAVADALVARGFRWVRLLDTYPRGSETWVYLYDGEDPELIEIE